MFKLVKRYLFLGNSELKVRKKKMSHYDNESGDIFKMMKGK